MPTNTYYVRHAVGNDGNAGNSEGAAWKTIGKAMDTVVAGDLVYVQGGQDYIEDHGASGSIGQIQTAGGADNFIIFEGYVTTPGDGTLASVILNAGTNALASCLDDGALASLRYEFKFFRFTGASSSGVNFNAGDLVAFFKCRADNNGVKGFNGDNVIFYILCQSDNNSNIGMDADNDAYFFGCSVFSNSSIGIRMNNGNASKCLVYNNTIINIAGESISVSVEGCMLDGENTIIGINLNTRMSAIINNIIYDCTTGIQGEVGNGGISLNNLFFSNTNDVVNWPTDASDIFGDPLFVDEPSDDYRLGSGSPALQAGIDAGELTNNESFIDVGAHQKEAAVASVFAIPHEMKSV